MGLFSPSPNPKETSDFWKINDLSKEVTHKRTYKRHWGKGEPFCPQSRNIQLHTSWCRKMETPRNGKTDLANKQTGGRK